MTDRSSPMNSDAPTPPANGIAHVTSADVPFQPTSIDIWEAKYRLTDPEGNPIDKTMDDTHKRVARALADAEIPAKREEWYEKFLWALRNGAIGAGRITSNAGAQQYKPATSLINCVVSGKIEDSMDSIMTRVYEGAMTLRKGSGIGYDMSTMRPKGAFVAGAGASTSGPLSFMDIYDKMCFTVASAGGRRGAQMATFDVGHPDVLDFIRAKRESGRLRQFNLSLLITDGFMKAVETDAMWPLAFPIHQKEADKYDLDDPEKILWREWPTEQNLVVRESDGLVACRIYKTIKAQNLWNAIMTSTYDFAEPGFILIDKVNDDNNNWWMENIRATNPCVVGETLLTTRDGDRMIKDLVGQWIDIWNGYEWSNVCPRITGVNQTVVTIHFSNGKFITNTLYHKYHLRDGRKVEAKDLVVGDQLAAYRLPDGSEDVLVDVVGIVPVAGFVSEVFCFTELKNHTGLFNGIVAGNCGEQPLPPFGACWTGSMRVPTNMGLLRTDDLYKISEDGADVLVGVDSRFSGHKTNLRPSRIVCQGKRLVREYALKNGQKIELTDDHLVHVAGASDEWKKAGGLVVGDKVSLQNAGVWDRPMLSGFDRGVLYYVLFERFGSCHAGQELSVTKSSYRKLLKPIFDRLFVNYFERHKVKKSSLVTMGISMNHDVILEVRNVILEDQDDVFWRGFLFAARSSCGTFRGGRTAIGSMTRLELLKNAMNRLENTSANIVRHSSHTGVRSSAGSQKRDSYRLLVRDNALSVSSFLDLSVSASSEQLLGPPGQSIDIRAALAGWILTDGWLTDGKSAGLIFSSQDDVAERVLSAAFKEITQTRGELRVTYRGQKVDVSTIGSYAPAGIQALRTDLGLIGNTKSKVIRVPEWIFRGTEIEQSSFLSAAFCADGSIQKLLAISLTSSSREFLEDVQILLLNFGLHSHIRSGASKGHVFFTLRVKKSESYRFYHYIGFALNSTKQKKLETGLAQKQHWKEKIENYVSELVSVRDLGKQTVYDMEEPSTHTLVVNGIVVHNCLLGSVNLTRFVLDPFTPNASFDWVKYRTVVRYFTRMLDNVVEGNNLPLEQQRDEITRKRRHGMGFLGLGSTLTMLKIPYGSPSSLVFTEEVSRVMALVGWEVALELSEEKGPAPALVEQYPVTGAMLRQRPEMVADGYAIGDLVPGRILHARYSRYMQRVAKFAPDLVEHLAESGARFTHHTSIAPTGTISLSLANNASNGIEPSFAHHYSRNVIRSGRKSKEKVDVFSFELLAYRTLVNPDAMPYSEDPKAKLPDYFISADEVGPKQHVDIQAAAQPWIDSAISKTANVPTDFPYEEFKDIYLYAYQQGLKGCTTFRFNPAAFQGVLVKEKDLENTLYTFKLEDGEEVVLKGNEEVEYDGETHTAANLFDALKEGYYGKF